MAILGCALFDHEEFKTEDAKIESPPDVAAEFEPNGEAVVATAVFPPKLNDPKALPTGAAALGASVGEQIEKPPKEFSIAED